MVVVAKGIALSDESAAMDWIDANQLGRRNLTPDQMSYIRGRLYNRKKQKHGGQLPKGKCQSDTSLSPDALCKCGAQMWEVVGKTERKCRGCGLVISSEPDTASAIADKHGVSRRTVIRDGKREGGNGGVYGRQPKGAVLVCASICASSGCVTSHPIRTGRNCISGNRIRGQIHFTSKRKKRP